MRGPIKLLCAAVVLAFLALSLASEPLRQVAEAQQATPAVRSATGDHPTLIYSTYYGSTGGGERHSTSGHALPIDASGHAYITGMTSAGDLPLKNPYDTSPSGSLWDGYVAKLDSTGSALAYAT